MKPRNGAILGLLLLATCSEEAREPAAIESSRAALGVPPPGEMATWKRVGSGTSPDGRYLQAVAYDEARQVVVMFGGQIFDSFNWTSNPSNETWEWSVSTGKWTNRSGGTAPEPRAGAAMVYDAARKCMVLFGGRAGSGFNLEDTWEWEPVSGTWTNVSSGGAQPSARSQHGMVYERSSGKILLFGGGRSDRYSYDGTGVTASLGDGWELDPATHAWTPVAAGPSGRHDFGMVWDAGRKKVVLFGGLQTDIANATGVPKQDTWEYDPEAGAWTERTAQGSKPSQRYAHSMAFDVARGKAVLFGGWDIGTGAYLNDVWDWDPTSGAWTERTRDSASNGGPSGHLYAGLVWVDATSRMELVAGAIITNPYGGVGGYVGPLPIGNYGTSGSRDVWELEPSSGKWLDRTTPLDVPSPRSNHAMAYYPVTGKTYVFGGNDMMTGVPRDDLWEFDGKTWVALPTKLRPAARSDAGLAYDPARKSLVLFGGISNNTGQSFNDTWEWTSTGGWNQLRTIGSPDALYGHGMVTDTVRSKVLLFGGVSTYYWYYGVDGGLGSAPWKDPMRAEIWEWDGAKQTWTNRTPTASAQTPLGRQYPALAFDEARQKLFLYDGYNYNYNTGASTSAFWEWDIHSGGWQVRDPGEWLDGAYTMYVVYDNIRRREIMLTDGGGMGSVNVPTWELDARGPTWYMQKTPESPGPRYNAAMAFDSGRGVVVLFGGNVNLANPYVSETWEYRVSNWGNGEGCTAAFASSCASGNCVDGVCCDSNACSGPCKSCNVPGSEGTCLPAKAGTEVPGSCSNGQACDGSGKCTSSNGQPCTSGSSCASGFCSDGVCCDGACTGACVSCAIAGREGKCSPYPVGTDPQSECGKGTGVCRSTCDGVSGCVFPSSNQPCASCTVCNGNGSCNVYDPYCSFSGGGGSGGFGGTGGYTTVRGGSGGYTTARGGTGGYTTVRGGSGGSGGYTTVRGGSGGSGGYTTARGGSGGSGGTTTARGGSGGSGGWAGSGGTTTARGGSGGYVTARGGSGGYTYPLAGAGGTTPDDDLITTAKLHRSGCSCAVGAAEEPTGGSGLAAALVMLGATLAIRLRRRR